MDADDLLNRLDSIGTVDEAATWAAQACLEISRLRATISAIFEVADDWSDGFDGSAKAMERITLLRDGISSLGARRH